MSSHRDAGGSSSHAGDSIHPVQRVLAHLQADYVRSALYFTRIGTMFCCLAFLFSPFFSRGPPADLDVWYRRALLVSAAAWALRLHQRLKSGNDSGVSRPLRETLLTEDAFHYLAYSILFAFLTPVSGDGPNVSVSSSQPSFFRRILQSAVTKVNTNNEPILRWIALNEIMLMFVCIFMAVSGPRAIVLPFLYYPFLKMRYSSRRNPYCRIAFSELRVSLQALAYHPKCPGFLSRLINGLIQLVCRLSPSGH
ncbi:hypothetical protein T265_03352 [Opisthorchis viverrini]|uniref:Transmembrane protein 33 n=1 Tax=Opisthorchis viverrini TaxID=6198 RepID=A0A075AHN6_OPIVI|nr:hypothetical protein T265_03352 [Opisthorchis viverrini]KER30199.1 hypothetical protein T265_03352 [Opisthorchis viverrini]